MMRPIMVQHSDAYMEEVNGAEHWDTKYEKVNEELVNVKNVYIVFLLN